MAYTYQADDWCDACGEAIRAALIEAGRAPTDPDDETSYDSDDFPKYYDAEIAEADSPHNCASGDCDGERGTFLENALTPEGYRSLKSMLDNHGSVLPEHAKEWAEYYQFSYRENKYTSAHEWLDEYISELASTVAGTGAAELVSIARTLAGKLSGDDIQDEYQGYMDDDGYFDEAGWFSPEMES